MYTNKIRFGYYSDENDEFSYIRFIFSNDQTNYRQVEFHKNGSVKIMYASRTTQYWYI